MDHESAIKYHYYIIISIRPNNTKNMKDPQIKISLPSVQDLEQVDIYKYIGIILNKRLTWVTTYLL